MIWRCGGPSLGTLLGLWGQVREITRKAVDSLGLGLLFWRSLCLSSNGWALMMTVVSGRWSQGLLGFPSWAQVGEVCA